MSAEEVAAAAQRALRREPLFRSLGQRIQELRTAQVESAAIDFDGRRRWLGRFRDWLLYNEDRLHRLAREETGKPWDDLAMGEVAVAVDVLNYFMGRGEEFLTPVHERPHSPAMATKKLAVEYSPYPSSAASSPRGTRSLRTRCSTSPRALMGGCAVLFNGLAASRWTRTTR